MTIRELIASRLCDQGLYPSEADIVLLTISSPEYENSELRGVSWSSPRENYPNKMLGVLLAIAIQEAIKYLEENKPQHFALHILKGTIP